MHPCWRIITYIAIVSTSPFTTPTPSLPSVSTAAPSSLLPPLPPVIKRVDLATPEITKLWLPSSLPAQLIASLGPKCLRDTELKLQRAQAEAQLHNIRGQIGLKAGLLHDKNVHVDGACILAYQWSRTVINRIQDKIDQSVSRYNACCCAVIALDSTDDVWTANCKVLWPEDCKPLTTVSEMDQVKLWPQTFARRLDTARGVCRGQS